MDRKLIKHVNCIEVTSIKRMSNKAEDLDKLRPKNRTTQYRQSNSNMQRGNSYIKENQSLTHPPLRAHVHENANIHFLKKKWTFNY